MPLALRRNAAAVGYMVLDIQTKRRSKLLSSLLLASLATLPAAAAQPITPRGEGPAASNQLPLGLPPSGAVRAKRALVSLGSFLFQSKVLSIDGSVACQTCHSPALSYAGDKARAVGVGGYTAPRRAPSLVNLYLYKDYMADGRAPDLAAQHLLPLESKEMRVNWGAAVAALNADPRASRLRQEAGIPAFSRDSIVRSLAAFVGSLVSGGSRFDRFYYAGDNGALNSSEQRGLRLFVRKGHCSSCHLLDGRAAPLTDGGFHATGVGFVHGAYEDHGRSAVTGHSGDDGLFKTPGLRNVALRPFLMHDGSMRSLEEVVRFYNRGCELGARNLDPRLKPLYLSDPEIDDIVAFLKSLTAPVVLYEQPEPTSGSRPEQ